MRPWRQGRHGRPPIREQLVRAGAFARLFARFDAALSEQGYLAKGGQIVDATIVEARRPRLTQAEKEVVKGGGVPGDWKPARTRQMDRDGRWTLKRGKKKPVPPGGPSPHDGAQPGAVLDPANTASPVWADTAYRSAANIEMLERRGLKPQFQRPKPGGKPMPRHLARGNARRARIRSRVGHVFAARKRRFALVIPTVGQARATAKLAPANLA